MKKKCKTKWKANPTLEQAEDRISELEYEMVIKGKTEELLNDTRPMKRKCKNSLTPSKDQT
jgi:hypothetical protein